MAEKPESESKLFLGNPPPDWRWKQVMQVVEATAKDKTQPRKLSTSDPWIHKACEYLRAKKAAATPTERKDLVEKFPEIFVAQHVLRMADPGWELVRNRIEALILADETQKAIAKNVCLDLKTIQAFEALFFDVRCHLGEAGYQKSVVKSAIAAGEVTGDHPDGGWKTLALLGGVRVLHSLWNRERVDHKTFDILVEVLRQRMSIEAEVFGTPAPSC